MRPRKKLKALRIFLCICVGAALGVGSTRLVAHLELEARRNISYAVPHMAGSLIHLYRADHDGEYPADLEVAYEQGYVEDESFFVDPLDPQPKQIGQTGLKCSFEYVGPIPKNSPEWTIIGYSRKGIHPGERVVLYNDRDRTVEWVGEADLHGGPEVGRRSLGNSYRTLIELFGGELTEERKAELKEFYEIED